jgi:hypothetical protein
MMSDSGSSKASQSSLGGGSIVVSVREAITRGDRQAALRLLRALTLSEPQEAVALTPATAEALVATARAEPEERGRAAVEAYRAAEAEYLVIADQIRQTPLEREHVAGLRALLDVRERELDQELSEQRLKDPGARGTSPLVQVGNGWLEVKWIPRKSGKPSGPYLYYRVREGGHLRSRYIGKAST